MLAATIARAQTGTDEAERLFQEGVRATEQGDFAAAAEAFRASYELSPVPDTLYNVAMCLKALGNFPAAANAFRAYVAIVGERMTADERQEFDGLLQELVPRIGRLAIRTSVVGAPVSIDDVMIGTVPVSGWYAVQPGSHRVSARTSDLSATAEIDVPAGQLVTVDLDLVATAGVHARAPDDESPELMPWFWGAVGVAGATAIVMAITGGLTLSYREEYEASGFADAGLRDTTLALRTTTDVMLGIALAAAVTGVVLFVLDDGGAEGESPPPTVGLWPGGLLLTW